MFFVSPTPFIYIYIMQPDYIYNKKKKEKNRGKKVLSAHYTILLRLIPSPSNAISSLLSSAPAKPPPVLPAPCPYPSSHSWVLLLPTLCRSVKYELYPILPTALPSSTCIQLLTYLPTYMHTWSAKHLQICSRGRVILTLHQRGGNSLLSQKHIW